MDKIEELKVDLRKNHTLKRAYKKFHRRQMEKEEIKSKGEWPIIKRLMGNTIFLKTTRINEFKKVQSVDNTEFEKDFEHNEPIMEPLEEDMCDDIDIMNRNWNELLPKATAMIRKKTCCYEAELSCFILGLFMETVGVEIINFLGSCIGRGFTPCNIKRSRITLISKASGNKFRPLSIMHPLYRLMDFLIYEHLSSIIKIPQALFHQFGFQEGVGAFDCVLAMKRHIMGTSVKSPLAMISIDLKDAFDNLSLATIGSGLLQIGIEEKIIALILQHINHRWSFINKDGEKRWKKHTKGTPQGGFLSPLLFSIATILLNPIESKHFKFFMYADDICIFATGIVNSFNTWHIVEKRLHVLNELVNQCGLSIGNEKTKFMILRSSPVTNSANSITLNGKSFLSCNQIKFIGHCFTNAGNSNNKCPITVTNMLQTSLHQLETILLANASAFRGLPIRWARLVLIAFIKGRTEYYGPTQRLFRSERNFAKETQYAQDCISRMIKLALDLKRSSSLQLIFYTFFKTSLINQIERSFSGLIRKFSQRNVTSWLPDFRLPNLGEIIIAGIPSVGWMTKDYSFMFECQESVPNLRYKYNIVDHEILIKVQNLISGRSKTFKYWCFNLTFQEEIADAIYNFILNDDIGKTYDPLIIAAHSNFISFMTRPKKINNLSLVLRKRESKTLFMINKEYLFKPDEKDKKAALRVVYDSINYHELVNILDHLKLANDTSNIALKGLHTYCFKTIDWKLFDRVDMYKLTIIAGAWHSSDWTPRCRLCNKNFSSMDFLTEPCIHIISETSNTPLSQEQIISSFGSIYKFRKILNIFYKVVTFLKKQNQ